MTDTPSNTSIPVDELRLKVLIIIDEKRSRYKVSEAIAEFAQAYAEQVALEARLDELNKLTTWKVSETGDDLYDILYARHKRSYADRVALLKEKQSLLNKKGEN